MSEKTIVLIHGFGSNNRIWDSYADFFSGHKFQVIAPNLRYHAPGDNLSGFEMVGLQDYVNDLETLVKNLDNKPILMGYSMGALIALKLLEKGYGTLGICLAPAAPKGINAISFSVLRLFFKNFFVWRFWTKVHKPRFSSAWYGALGDLPVSKAF